MKDMQVRTHKQFGPALTSVSDANTSIASTSHLPESHSFSFPLSVPAQVSRTPKSLAAKTEIANE